ncbi:hypothetical protein [Micromonospora sp. CV4]|uniref:hypothetical protein n=1 Tax=Micromonospora sp. CV4 TaxID=2478711 RepID=UPI001315A2C5|nr:hypothetical protein [Micromonospora sp. CV4]
MGVVVAGIGPKRRAARENARLRAALLGGEIPPKADVRPDRVVPGGHDAGHV